MSDNMFIHPVKVAVIDDNAEFGIGVKMLLAREDVEVYTAADGPEGLEMAKQLLPDIVLLDVVMPGMDGVEVCKKIRQIPEMKGAYIVMLSSAKIHPDEMAEGLEAGADGYIARPIPNRELLARLRAFIRIKRAEKALQITEAKYHRIADNVTDVIWVTDLEMNPTYISPSVERVFGVKPEVFLKLPLSKTYPPASMEKFKKTLTEQFAKEKDPEADKNRVFQLEVERYCADGTIGWDAINATFIRDQHMNPVALQGVSRDITDRKRSEQALAHSHELMRYVIEHSNSAIAIHDKDLKYIYVSQRYLHDYKVKEKEIIGKHHYEVFPDLPQKWRDVHKKALSGVISREDNDCYPREDGTLEWTRWECRPWYEADGTIGGIILSSEVITERKQAEIALAKSEENLSTTLKSIGDGVISTDINGLIVNMNPIAEKLCGWTSDEAAGKPLSEVFRIVNDITRQTVADPVEKVLEKGEIVGLANHTILISKDGKEYQIADSAAPIKNREGAITGVVLVFSDITENYFAQKQIKESEERYSRLLQNLEAGIIVHAPDTSIVMNNPRASQLLGLTQDQMKGKVSNDPAWSFVNEDNTPLNLDEFPVHRIIQTRQPIKNHTLGINRPDSQDIVWVTVNGFPVLDRGGEISEIVISIIDITERKQAEQELKRIEWLLTSRPQEAEKQKHAYVPPYGDLVTLNTSRFILDSVGEQILSDIVGDYLNLLDTSAAVYEKNGDYALGIFSSGWCRFMDAASRAICDTDDNREALACGRWHCHESCWSRASLTAIQTGQPADIECDGGIRLYAAPIRVGDEIAGAINFGYGNPPRDEEKLRQLATRYQVSYEELRTHALNYEARPPYIIELAKQRLLVSARLIGEITERKQSEILIQRKTEEIEAQNEELNQTNQELIAAKEKAEFAEEVMRESEERFQLAMNASNDGLWDWNLQTNDIYYSPAWKKILGYEDHELPNDFSVWENTTAPEDVKKSWALQQKLITKQIDQFVVDFKMKHKHGHWVDVLSRAKAFFDDNGNAIRIVGTHTDITERKKAAEALRQSEEMMRSSQSVAHICSYSTNLNINEIEKSYWVCSPEFYKIFGIDKTYPHTIEGWAGFIHPDYREEIFAYHESVVKEKKAFNREYKIIRINDGAERWVHGTGELEFDKKGKPVRMHGAIQDITDRKNAEDELRQSEERLQSVLQSQQELICRYKPDTTITFANQAFCKYFNNHQDQVLGKSWLKLFPENDTQPVDNKTIAEYIFDYIEKGPDAHTFEQRIENPNGSINWISWSNQKIRNDKNQLVEIQSVGNDITDKKEREKLESEIEVANKSLMFKQNFLANMSHEIRTPLTGIIGITDILAQTDLKPQQKQYLATLKQSTENLHEIINQILDYSKIEAGKIELRPVSFAIQTIFDHAIHLFNSANHKPIELKTEISDNLPKFIHADQSRIQQIISNLVSNALKFTPEGEIILRATTLKELPSHKIIIKIEVEDSGIGIDKTNLKYLFKPFSQIDHRDTRTFEGTGLGLSICKDLALLLNGEIDVESMPGKGSRFWFTFEADLSSEAQYKLHPQEDNETKNNKMLRILLVEDKLVNQKVIELMLTSQGHVVNCANNGRQAVEMYTPEAFDIILMDIQMPVMDGIKATQIIREKFGSKPLIVGLSANAFEGDKEKYLARGMDDYLTKPVKGEDFKTLVSKWFRE